MTGEQRERFDALLQDAIDAMPEQFREAIDEIPIIVVDRPDAALVKELIRDGVLEPGEEDPMGLHTGVAITERSVEWSGGLPGTIHIFRAPIVDLAGGWDQANADDEIYEEIRVTLLHELGHHFGLDEDDLDRLGYS
ncbi:MAG: metallopeptidase family protein [Phycisphaerae bacterium]|nr:metallopeptidase family protein [Phycisphaerae bacterium]